VRNFCVLAPYQETVRDNQTTSFLCEGSLRVLAAALHR